MTKKFKPKIYDTHRNALLRAESALERMMKAVRKDLTVSYQDQLALQELKTDAQVALIKIQNLLASEKDNRQEV